MIDHLSPDEYLRKPKRDLSESDAVEDSTVRLEPETEESPVGRDTRELA